jgi:Sulfotransferase family
MIEGFVEQVLSEEVRGWSFDRDRPNAHLVIDIYCGGHLLGSTHADIFRSDLANGRIGSGDHAFQFRFPTKLDEQQMATVAVRIRSALDPAGVRELPRFLPNARADTQQPAPAVAASAYQDDTQFPVFVLGAPRSGTTAVALALMAAASYAGYGEGQVIDLLVPLQHALGRFYEARADEIMRPGRGTMLGKIPEEYFSNGIFALFTEAIRQIFPSRRWCDKTPTADMIWAAPSLARIWPNAKFVFLKRRGLENLLSRTQKFQGFPFEDQCLGWTACMEAWRAVRDGLAGRALELDQHFLARYPERSAEAIGQLLALESQQTRELARKLKHLQPERTSENVFDTTAASKVPWDPAQWAVFNRVCGPTMAAYGYSQEDEYYAPGAEDRSCLTL